MPQRPYLPLGTLRAAVSYPDGPERFDDAAVRAALERVDLGHLALARSHRALGPPADARRAAAPGIRAPVAAAPRWVVLDDAVGALDEEHRRLVLSIFERELASATVIHFGRGPVLLLDRTHIIEQPGGPASMPACRRRRGRWPRRPRAPSRARRARRPRRSRGERAADAKGTSAMNDMLRAAPRSGQSRMAAPGGACVLPQAPSARSQRRSPARSRAEADLPYFWDFAHPTSGLARERSNQAFGYGPEVVTTGAPVRHHDHHRGNRAPLAQQARGARSPAADGPLPLHGGQLSRHPSAFSERRDRPDDPFTRKDDGGDLVETSFSSRVSCAPVSTSIATMPGARAAGPHQCALA